MNDGFQGPCLDVLRLVSGSTRDLETVDGKTPIQVLSGIKLDMINDKSIL